MQQNMRLAGHYVSFSKESRLLPCVLSGTSDELSHKQQLVNDKSRREP